MKTTMPTFSGNINDYLVNYLIELDMIMRLAMTGKLKLGSSPKSSDNFQFRTPNKLPYSH